MGRREILHTRLGEMLEMLDCHAIANGANQKNAPAPMRFEDAMKLR